MKAMCVENKFCNTNFTVGKSYELFKHGIRTNFGGICVSFHDCNKPENFEVGSIFSFGLCKFEIV